MFGFVEMLRTFKAFDFSVYVKISFEVVAFVISVKTHDIHGYKWNLCTAFEKLSGSCSYSLGGKDIEGKTVFT